MEQIDYASDLSLKYIPYAFLRLNLLMDLELVLKIQGYLVLDYVL